MKLAQLVKKGSNVVVHWSEFDRGGHFAALEAPDLLIEGGGRGIGKATCLLLAARGATVVVNYLSNHGAAESVVSNIRSTGGEAISLQADVRSQVQFSQLVSYIFPVDWGKIRRRI